MPVLYDLEHKAECSACSACFAICPVKAISLKVITRDFYIPK